MEWLDTHAVTLLNGLARGLLLFMIAAGLSLIYGLMQVLNLAHGALFALGAYLALWIGMGSPMNLAALGGAVLTAGILCGLLLKGMLLPARAQGHMNEILVTLGLMYVLVDVLVSIWGARAASVAVPPFLAGSVPVLGATYPKYRLAVLGVGLLVGLVLWLLLERTRAGSIIRATVADTEMAVLSGINPGRVRTVVFLIGSILAVFAGALAGPIISVTPAIAMEYLLLAFIVLVVGGPGSLLGAFVGSIFIGLVQTLGVALVPEFSGFLLFGAMALVLVIRPQGLFGKET